LFSRASHPTAVKNRLFGHARSFDQRRERSWTTIGEHMPDGTGRFSDRTELAALRVALVARASDGKDREKRCCASK
jgi:hypothetical protein